MHFNRLKNVNNIFNQDPCFLVMLSIASKDQKYTKLLHLHVRKVMTISTYVIKYNEMGIQNHAFCANCAISGKRYNLDAEL